MTYKDCGTGGCQFVATTGGTSAFIVGTATAGNQTPEQQQATDGKVYEYYAQSADGSQWEMGEGAYSYASHTLARTTITWTSNQNTSVVNFTTPPQVYVYPSEQPGLESPFPSGTLMLFQQAAAPVGWTRQTTYNDAALRIVSGNPSAGGSNAFSTVFAQTTVGNHTLASAEIAGHDHQLDTIASGGTGTATGLLTETMTYSVCPCSGGSNGGYSAPSSTGSTGGGDSHNHSIIMSITYVDFIICKRD